MYKDLFRSKDTMARSFVSAIAAGGRVVPDFWEGWQVCRTIDLAKQSAREGRKLYLDRKGGRGLD